MANIFFTKEGLEKVKKEYQEFLEKRKEAVETLRRAREMGDLSENGLYKAAKFELGNIDRNIRRLSHYINKGVIAAKPTGSVGIGSKVTVIENKIEKYFFIVGDMEANPKENKISSNSPLGKSLLNGKKGESINLDAPSGRKTFKIIDIE